MNEGFSDPSGRIQASGGVGVVRAAPNADNWVGVLRMPERKR